MLQQLLLATALGGVAEAQECTQGAGCGGQVWSDCGTACPLVCGQPAAEMCTENCVAEYQCPSGQCFNDRTGACAAVEECTQGAGCGGQVWSDCGTACPLVCGQPAAEMCTENCVAEYQCPSGQCFNDRTGACAAVEDAPEPPESLWCAESPVQSCRMVCPDVAPCREGQCHMRSGECCDSVCQDVATTTSEEECTGCCPEGAACFAPDPACCSTQREPEKCNGAAEPLRDSAGVELFCGRGISRVDCPADSTCDVHPADAWAVCCPDSDNTRPACREDSDCPVSSDQDCGYSCLEGECAMYCAAAPPGLGDDQESTQSTDDKIVRATLSLDGELEAVAGAEGSSAREQFEIGFATDVAALLRIDSQRVVIASIVSGSVVVTFDIMPDVEDRAIEVAAVETAFAEAGVPLRTLGLTTARPVTGLAVQAVGQPETGSPSTSPGPPVLARASGVSRLAPAAACVVAVAVVSMVLA